MVRTYKPKNRIYRKSKLSEDQVLQTLAFTLALAPNWKISERVGISEKSIKLLQRRYAEHLLICDRVRRYKLEELFKADMITQGLFKYLQHEVVKKTSEFWAGLEGCVFRCPKMLSFRTTEGGLAHFLEDFGDVQMPRLGAQAVLRVHAYDEGIVATKRISCKGCKYISNCGLNPNYSHLFFTYINAYCECRNFRKNNLKLHYLPAFFSFVLYFDAINAIGIHYPYDSLDELPSFSTREEFAMALIPDLVRNASRFIGATYEVLIEEPF